MVPANARISPPMSSSAGTDLPVAERWFSTASAADGVTMITERHLHPYIQSNLWLVRGKDRDLLVDTGNGVASLLGDLPELFDGREVIAVVTHGHADHMGGLHEFDERVCHRLEAGDVEHPPISSLLDADRYPEEEREAAIESGYGELPRFLLDAMPFGGFDPEAFAMAETEPTRTVQEGDVIDLGDRIFDVLHLPGHTPGSLALWESETSTLYSGDTIYAEEPLLDELPESNIPDYVESMRRLRSLPVETVHAGHDPSFGREELIAIVDAYIARRDTG
jgi:glyoxylase-like metal-dependent hydrolase (beta-lactamase superfamily II)